MQLAIGPLARLFTSHMYYFIENRSSWDSRHTINLELRNGIEFWRLNLKNRDKAYLQGNRQKQDMKKARLTINFKKSNFTPVQGSWLGFHIHTTSMKFCVPKTKIDHLNLLNSLSFSSVASARETSKIAGRIISMQLAIGPLARLFTSHMYYFIENRSSWDSRHTMNLELRNEIEFWRRNLKVQNGFQIKVNHVTAKIVYSDASDFGYGGFVVQHLGNILAQGKFSPLEVSTSSTFRELLAVKNILKAVSSHLCYNTCLLYTSPSPRDRG